MHRIHYAGDSIVTGSAIARALLDYAQALAQVSESATVEIPTLTKDGRESVAEVLIGPASQLSAHEEPGGHDEITDEALVTRMSTEADRLRRYGSSLPAAGIVTEDSVRVWSDLEDL